MEVTYQQQDRPGGNLGYTWGPMAQGDTGRPANHSGTGDRTVQVFGVFGVGGTVEVEGSLDGENWQTLHDTQGLALTFRAAGIQAVLENAVYIRPRVSGGDGTTSISMILNVRR